MALGFRSGLHLYSRIPLIRHICGALPSSNMKKGLVLGCYEGSGEISLSPVADKYNTATNGRLRELLELSGPVLKAGKVRVLYGLESTYSSVAVVGLGKKELGYNELEELDESREAIREAIATGCRTLRELDVGNIVIDSCSDPEAAAEGAKLGLWVYQELKDPKKHKPNVELNLADPTDDKSRLWNEGSVKADSQNLARRLMEAPANHMTPTIFANTAKGALESLGVTVVAHDKAWAESKKMGSFLSVSRGSIEPPIFLELTYNGGQQEKPVVLVGKGITFDSGGISLKPSAKMDLMRADMGGGANVVGAIYAAASLKIPINIKGLVALSENLPSGSATKPGDVVTAMNGKTIQIDNTDAEGRLVLADALCYAHEFNPRYIIDLATLTGAMSVALGGGATGVFTNSGELWTKLSTAGRKTGDRMWRMPLFKMYRKQISDAPLADLNNISGVPAGGACTAAAFLKEFVTSEHWAHLDIAGVMSNSDEVPYLGKGMAGRPCRTIIQFLIELAK